jgi:hypothetical protein
VSEFVLNISPPLLATEIETLLDPDAGGVVLAAVELLVAGVELVAAGVEVVAAGVELLAAGVELVAAGVDAAVVEDLLLEDPHAATPTPSAAVLSRIRSFDIFRVPFGRLARASAPSISPDASPGISFPAYAGVGVHGTPSSA